MAVTITRAQLAARIRLGRTDTELDEAEQILVYATEAVTKHAPDAPDVVHNEAVYRLSGYVYDRPFASADTRFSNALRNSGAAAAFAALPRASGGCHHVNRCEGALRIPGCFGRRVLAKLKSAGLLDPAESSLNGRRDRVNLAA